jgi:hypothetical protein
MNSVEHTSVIQRQKRFTIESQEGGGVAFLVPVYPPHYHSARNLIDSFIKNNLHKQAQLYLVFTNFKEKSQFGDFEFSLTLPPESFAQNKRQGLVNIKKLWAIKQIYRQYDYIIVMDADSLFIKNVNISSLCKDYFDAKVLYGNRISKGYNQLDKIKEPCKRFYSFHPEREKLDSELYLWFNNLCIYNTKHIDDFFEVINYDENIKYMGWADFEYYIYMYYLILYHGFIIDDIEIESNLAVYETNLASWLNFKSEKYKSIKTPLCAIENLNIFDNEKLFIAIHTDRTKDKLIKNLIISNSSLNKKIDELYVLYDDTEKNIIELLAKCAEIEKRSRYFQDELYKSRLCVDNLKNIVSKTAFPQMTQRKLLSVYLPFVKLFAPPEYYVKFLEDPSDFFATSNNPFNRVYGNILSFFGPQPVKTRYKLRKFKRF